MKKFAFTLAEIMIVLSVIAVLTAILLPAARNAMPNEDLMKFKRGHLAFINVINELLNSDKYYLNGDLGTRPNNDKIDTTHDGDNTYFCETFADVLGNIKEKNCQEEITKLVPGLQISFNQTSFEENTRWADGNCKTYQEKGFLPDIVTSDGISYYQTAPTVPFGSAHKVHHMQAYGELSRCIANSNCCDWELYSMGTPSHMQYVKIFCMDIDGFNQGENPFGYGVRRTGKVYLGKRATEWFKKTIQDKD